MTKILSFGCHDVLAKIDVLTEESELDIYLYTVCSPFHPQNLLGVWKTDGIWTRWNFLTKLFHQIFSLPPPLFSPALNPLRVKWAYLALSSNFTWFRKFEERQIYPKWAHLLYTSYLPAIHIQSQSTQLQEVLGFSDGPASDWRPFGSPDFVI